MKAIIGYLVRTYHPDPLDPWSVALLTFWDGTEWRCPGQSIDICEDDVISRVVKELDGGRVRFDPGMPSQERVLFYEAFKRWAERTVGTGA